LACLIVSGCGQGVSQLPPRTSTSFSVRASVEQLHLWNAEPDKAIEVLGPQGELAAEGTTDYQGSLVFRELSPGDDYSVRLADTPDDYTNRLDVMSVEGSLPDESFYANQKVEPGYGYLTVRDGTTLSYFAVLPGPPEDGPYPTLVNYSGYSPSRPGKSLGNLVEAFCEDFPILCNAPGFGSGLIAGIMGYAVIGVNMRGTGCSGGAYDYFEPLQLLDGYDVIEIVARQDWVKFNKVGMSGLSYPGITQLFVASTNPPSLAAISPFSVIADTASSTLVPGGIYNHGFALSWIENVLNKSAPYAHGWIKDLVEAGDTVCEENQLLHSQMLDAVAKALDNPFYSDEVAKPLDPSSFVHRIDVPVFLVGQWQDEQTGPHFPALFDKFTSSPIARFTATNGVHPDGFAPQVLGEWSNFLSLYVAREIPSIPPELETIVNLFLGQMFGPGLDLPESRFDDYTDFDQARADYESENPVRVIFETGAAEGIEPGAPLGTFDEHFSEWPIPETVASRWYFHPDGSLAGEPPDSEGDYCSFVHDPEAGLRTYLDSGSINDTQPGYGYRQLVDGKAASFVSAPLEEDLVMVGHGSVDLWIRSTATDADLEVNLTEIRPDGMESYVQSGWLRASHRALRSDATELRPVKSHYKEDVELIVPGDWTVVRVELMPFGHIFRAGSRIGLSVDTPGDSRASWTFLLLEYDTQPTHDIAHDSARPSSVVLPVIPSVEVATEMPDCTALRGQPCREYVPYQNTVGN